MNIQAQKIELIQLLLNTSKPSIINKIKAILYEEAEEVIGISDDGTPLTIAKLEREIEEAEADVYTNNYRELPIELINKNRKKKIEEWLIKKYKKKYLQEVAPGSCNGTK